MGSVGWIAHVGSWEVQLPLSLACACDQRNRSCMRVLQLARQTGCPARDTFRKPLRQKALAALGKIGLTFRCPAGSSWRPFLAQRRPDVGQRPRAPLLNSSAPGAPVHVETTDCRMTDWKSVIRRGDRRPSLAVDRDFASLPTCSTRCSMRRGGRDFGRLFHHLLHKRTVSAVHRNSPTTESIAEPGHR